MHWPNSNQHDKHDDWFSVTVQCQNFANLPPTFDSGRGNIFGSMCLCVRPFALCRLNHWAYGLSSVMICFANWNFDMESVPDPYQKYNGSSNKAIKICVQAEVVNLDLKDK